MCIHAIITQLDEDKIESSIFMDNCNLLNKTLIILDTRRLMFLMIISSRKLVSAIRIDK